MYSTCIFTNLHLLIPNLSICIIIYTTPANIYHILIYVQVGVGRNIMNKQKMFKKQLEREAREVRASKRACIYSSLAVGTCLDTECFFIVQP